MDSLHWEPLPPRKKKKNNNIPIGKVGISTYLCPQEGFSDIETTTERIAQNITERSLHNRSHTTLQSNDGCAGEFYECKLSIMTFRHFDDELSG
jgi:SHS2 domain-containing protein